MTDKTAYDIVDFSLNKNAEGIAQAFDDMIRDRIAGRIEDRKQELATLEPSNEPQEQNPEEWSEEEMDAFLASLSPEELAELEAQAAAELEQNPEQDKE